MRLAPLVSIAALLTVALIPCDALAKDSKADKAKAKVARELVSWAGWCSRNGAPEQGTAAMETAHAFGATDTAPLVADLNDADQLADEAAIARGLKVHGPKIAKAYDELGGVKHDDAQAAEFAGYRIEALRWDPSKKRAKKIASWALGLKDRGLAARSLAGAWSVADDEDAGAAITSVFAAKGSKELLLLGSAEHPLVAFVALPRTWKKGKTYPVLIGVDGAGSGFEGYGKKSSTVRGTRDVIGLYPMTLSNTNALAPKKYPHYDKALLDEHSGVAKRLEFDLAGVNAVLALVQQHLGGEEKVFLTGFSGGGQFTYLKLLQEPQTVAGAVPCCANFAGGGVQGAPGAGDDGGPPVLLLTGENDKHRDYTHGDESQPGIEPQTDAAEQALAKLGYRNVTRRMVPAGHSPLHEKVWEFVDEVRGKR
jgi:predicted esterase